MKIVTSYGKLNFLVFKICIEIEKYILKILCIFLI
jgi:hypothetical protein